MKYVQPCGSCVGAVAVLERIVDRESEASRYKTDRATRLEHRKERPHRLARMLIQAIELRIEVLQHDRAVVLASQRLAKIPRGAACPVCLGARSVESAGRISGGIPSSLTHA